jgi:hypothetical protein
MMHNEVREIKVSIKLQMKVVRMMKLMWALQYSTGWFQLCEAAAVEYAHSHIVAGKKDFKVHKIVA